MAPRRRLPPLPPHVLNGVTVAIGIALAQVSMLAVGPDGAAKAASAGAVYASLPHLVDRAGRSTRRAFAGGVLGSATAALLLALAPVPGLLDLGIACLVFAAMMTMAWGPRAGPISFTVVLAIVFSLAARPSLRLFDELAWTLAGAAIYSAWAYASTRLLERRYRTLAVARALETSARLLISRAKVLETRAPSETEASERWEQIDEETRLATLLQSARELVFAEGPHHGGVDHVALVLRATELRDLLLTSRLDLELLGEDDVAYEIRRRLAASLRANATTLTELAQGLGSGLRVEVVRAPAPSAVAELRDEQGLPAGDPRLRLLPAIASRQQHVVELIAAIRELLRGARDERGAVSAEAGLHPGDERWPLSEVTRQLSWKSPVFRHALRSALALSLAHALSALLPWATHPHWLVLSVAVVLRGTFAQTRARRNDRIMGTALGCVVALGLATVLPHAAIAPVFWLAAGTAHAFVNVRYALTAVAATVMALLQTRTLQPLQVVVVLERLADTVAGAGLAWAFSYVLPSWSRRSLPALLETTLGALRAYAESAPSLAPDAPARQRLARERAYGSLEAFIAGVRLSRVEPERVRPPLPPLLSFIDHAQSLMAHLSSLRLMLLRRAEPLAGSDSERALDEARGRLAQRLTLDVEVHSVAPQRQPLDLELPTVPVDRAPFPWLLRRLKAAVDEANRTGSAARSGLALLRERASLRP
jgi:uncharacterized membrane protein YccC